MLKSKKYLRRIASLLLVIMGWAPAGFALEAASSQSLQAQYQNLLKEQKAGSSHNQIPFKKENLFSFGTDSEIDELKMQKAPQPEELTDVEEFYNKIISGEAKIYKFKPLKQFGYELFQQAGVDVSNSSDQIVSQEYVIGPGDSFTITMWGIAEGVFNVQVDPEGNIVLPKVGVVPAAGVKYGELKGFVEKQLSRYYEQVNVAVSIKNITGIRVYVVGEVKRPGTYNTSSLSTAFNSLFMAGGPTKKGSLRHIQVIRNGKTIAKIDLYNFLLYGNRRQDINLISGDTVFVPVIGPVAAVSGNVRRSGIYEINSDSDLGNFINMAGGILPTSYTNRVQIHRVEAHQKQIILDKQFSFSEKNPRLFVNLKDMDLVKIYPIYASVDNIVFLEGAVKFPGPYQWKNGMTIRDIINSDDAFIRGAYLPRAEVVRVDNKTFESNIFEFDLSKLLAGDAKQNYTLEPGDRLVVASEFKLSKKVNLKGEIRLPGDYAIGKGERLSSVIKRAGGFTEQAYLFGAVFKRKSAREVQAKSLKELVDQMETDLIVKEKNMSSLGLTEADLALKNHENESNRELIARLKVKADIEGRVIIVLKDPGVLDGTKDDIELENGDELIVPKISNVINVLGEVYNPSSVVFLETKNASYYLGKVGGTTSQANSGEIYLIRADGSIVSRRQGYDIQAMKLMPGDTILVPKSFEKYDLWLVVKDFTHWFYEATLAFAVIATYIKR